MELLALAAFITLVSIILVLLVCVFGDADCSTLFWEKFGTNLSDGLKGKVVWVTGASTGIGAAIAVQAAKHGAKLVLTARRKELLDDVKAKCRDAGANSDEVLVLPLDMCDYSKHQSAFDTVIEKFGQLDILINNAGRSQRARWEHIQLKVDEELFALNVFSVVSLTRTVLPHMLQRKAGRIAVMSSTAGLCGVPFSGTYTGSKHAIHGYFESLRTEKIGCGISISLLCPGPTFSNLLSVAATEKSGQNFGETMKESDKRMTSERCAELSLSATVNGLPESWICSMPVLPLVYASQYLPSVSRMILSLVGPSFLAKIRDSRNAMETDKLK